MAGQLRKRPMRKALGWLRDDGSHRALRSEAGEDQGGAKKGVLVPRSLVSLQ